MRRRSVCRWRESHTTPRGFEPLRAEPNGFRVHLLSRSDTVSCWTMIWTRPHGEVVNHVRYLVQALQENHASEPLALASRGSGKFVSSNISMRNIIHALPACSFRNRNMTPVGFEPTPLRTGALSQRLRPLGQSVLIILGADVFVRNQFLYTMPHIRFG